MTETAATCGNRTDEDSFGNYIECDKPEGHPVDGKRDYHHGWLVGNRKITEWLWTDTVEPFRID